MKRNAEGKVILEKDERRKCLNVGSGVDYQKSSKEEHWVNIDVNPKVEPDLVCAAEELSSNFEADTFDEVLLVHVWEHCVDLIKVMEEIWHVMKPGGTLKVVVPFYASEGAFGDPTHKHFIGRTTFGFVSYPVYEANAKTGTRMSQYMPNCDFDILRFAAIPQDEKEKFKDEAFAVAHYLNVYRELQAEMVCVKPIRKFDIKQYQKR